MISKDKQYKTKGGQEVRIYSTEAGGLFPVHGSVKVNGGKEWIHKIWTDQGCGNSSSNNIESSRVRGLDLIEIVPKVKVWVEYYLDRYGNFITARYFSEDTYLTYKAGGESCPTRTHLKLDVFEYEPKPETK
jgi:hypothetical protein